MSKSVPRSSRPKSRPSTPKRPVAKRPVHRRTRRPARRGTARVHDLGGEAGAVVQHVIPARTVARERALALFAELGVKASKPTLRRATDRIEKVIKANRGLPGVLGLVDSAPSLGALRDVARDEILKAGRAGDAAEQRALLEDGRGHAGDALHYLGAPLRETRDRLPADIVGIHESLRGAEQRREYTGPAVGNRVQSPASTAFDGLDKSISRLEHLLPSLHDRLGPVLDGGAPASPNGPSGSPPLPISLVGALSQLSDRTNELGARLEAILNSLVL